MSYYDENVYNKKFLKEKDRAFVNGFDCALKECVKKAKDNYLFDMECSKERKALLGEALDDFTQYLTNNMESLRMEYIVGMIENYSDEEYEQLVEEAKLRDDAEDEEPYEDE